MIQTAMFLSLAIAGLGSVLGQSTSEWTQLEANKRTVQGYLSLVADEKFDQWDKFFADTVLFNGNKMVPLLLNDERRPDSNSPRSPSNIAFTSTGVVAENLES